MTVVAVVVRLCGRRMTHQGGVGPVVAQVGVNRRGIGVIGSVLERRALVLFTPHTTHCQACRRRELDSAVSQVVVHIRNVYSVSQYCGSGYIVSDTDRKKNTTSCNQRLLLQTKRSTGRKISFKKTFYLNYLMNILYVYLRDLLLRPVKRRSTTIGSMAEAGVWRAGWLMAGIR